MTTQHCLTRVLVLGPAGPSTNTQTNIGAPQFALHHEVLNRTKSSEQAACEWPQHTWPLVVLLEMSCLRGKSWFHQHLSQ